MEKYNLDNIETVKQHNMHSLIMTYVDEIAEYKAQKDWEADDRAENFYVEEEDGSLRMNAEAQDIYNEYYDEEMDKFYNFVNKAIEVDSKKENQEGLTEEMIDRAYNSYVCMDYDETERVLKEIYNNPNIKDGSLIDHAHEDFQILQKFEFVFTVGDFFNQLRD